VLTTYNYRREKEEKEYGLGRVYKRRDSAGAAVVGYQGIVGIFVWVRWGRKVAIKKDEAD
jgi:hypothetical protein